MIWAITSYFNPAGYRRRLKNYHLFRQRLGVPLVAIELSFDGRFELCDGDADILLQLTGADVMWQKERLLNVALESVPAECQAVAWVDCDVLFEEEDWGRQAERALERYHFLHLFEERHLLPPSGGPPSPRDWTGPCVSRSIVSRVKAGEMTIADNTVRRLKGSTEGMAWASRREVLEKHGLYDSCILGGGDLATLYAAYGEQAHTVSHLRMNTECRDRYFSWAGPFHDTVRGNVGHIGGRAFHLWHGENRDRQYRTRYEMLREFRFDPALDIAIDSRTKAWRWNSDKPALHARVRDYFWSRKEDNENDPNGR